MSDRLGQGKWYLYFSASLSMNGMLRAGWLVRGKTHCHWFPFSAFHARLVGFWVGSRKDYRNNTDWTDSRLARTLSPSLHQNTRKLYLTFSFFLTVALRITHPLPTFCFTPAHPLTHTTPSRTRDDRKRCMYLYTTNTPHPSPLFSFIQSLLPSPLLSPSPSPPSHPSTTPSPHTSS